VKSELIVLQYSAIKIAAPLCLQISQYVRLPTAGISAITWVCFLIRDFENAGCTKRFQEISQPLAFKG